jgi:GTPase SAR1 family protein
MREIDTHCQTNNYVLVLVGTMLDMDNEKEITFKQGQQFSKQSQAIYFETSAKEGTNIKEMF